jgi:lambda family phage tail tape measure protein
MAQNLARLGVILGMDSAEFQKGLKSAKQSLKEFGDMAVTATKIGAVAFVAMTAKVITMADEIADLAKANEMSIASILKLSSAIELSGGKSESVGKILSSFTNKVDEAAQGGLKAQEAFKRINLFDALGTSSQTDLLNKTVEALAKMPDSITRNALAFELLGKGIRNTDIKELNEQLKKGSSEYEKYAISIEQAAELNDRLYSKSKKLALVFTAEVMPAVVAMFDLMTTKGGAAEVVFNMLGKSVIGLYAFFGEVGEALDNISAKFSAIKKGDFFGESGEYLNSMNQIALDRLQRQYKLFELLRDKSKDVAKPSDPFTGRSITPAKDPEAEKLKKQEEMLRVASLINVEYERERSFSLQQLAIRGQMEGMTTNERAIQEAINQQLDATSKKLEEITKKREDAAGRGANAKVLAEYDTQFALVQRNSEQYINASRIIQENTIATQRTFEYGWNKAFNQFAEDAGNYGKLAEDMFGSFTRNMNSAIDTFVENGTFSFSQFAESVIKDLLKIELRMQASQLLSMGIKFAVGAFGGASSPQYADPSYAYAGFADGGNPPVGVPSIVGERGPELFVPNRAGTIIPNNQLGNVLGGGGGVTYNGPYIASMQAIDTQSGIQFLAKNKMTIWSMNQSANRSIPAGR